MQKKRGTEDGQNQLSLVEAYLHHFKSSHEPLGKTSFEFDNLFRTITLCAMNAKAKSAALNQHLYATQGCQQPAFASSCSKSMFLKSHR